MIDKATVQRIKDAADIVEVVGDYVRLTKRGQNYMGLCPFHNERTPSFSVSRARNFCYCFSCHKGGSPVNFLMEKEGISYHDALLRLADKYGIKVEERELTDKERADLSEREAMLTVNEWAAMEMHNALTETSEGRDIGLSYLYGRGVTEEAIKKFRLGYSIDKGNWLVGKAEKAGYDIKTLIDVGVAIEGKERPYDRFRGRVMFPIMNSSGKVVAFGGRDLKGGPAKYMNSPESVVYKKSRELYGLFQAKNAMSREDKCYLVEGYLDVIGLWQSGIENVVASSGTALTDGQIALIHRFTSNVTLIYDGDAAGIKASLRGIDMLLANDMRVKVLLLPDGDDPDSFARKHTPEETRQYIAEHETDFIRYKTSILISAANDPSSRAEAVKSVVRSISAISDPIRRATYIQECAIMFSLSETMLTREVAAARRSGAWRQTSEIIPQRPVPEPVKKVEAEEPQNEKKQKYNDITRPREAELLRYAMAYGMMPFADAVSDDGETNEVLNVWQYIYTEMCADATFLTTPLLRRTFDAIGAMIDDYSLAAEENTRRLEEKYASDLQAGYDEIAKRDIGMSQIERAEEELRTRLDDEFEKATAEFASRFAADALLSHEDAEIRNLATRMLMPRHQLSKYHYKTATISTEADNLFTLIPRAIMEWKDSITAVRIMEIKKEISEAASDMERLRPLMEELQSLTERRGRFSKMLGERTIVPRNEI